MSNPAIDLSQVSLALVFFELLNLRHLASQCLHGNLIGIAVVLFNFVYQIRHTVMQLLTISQRVSITLLANSVYFRTILAYVAQMFGL